MRMLVAAICFAITLGAVFVFDNAKKQGASLEDAQFAQILNSPASQDGTSEQQVSKSPIPKTKMPTVSPAPSLQSPSPSITSSNIPLPTFSTSVLPVTSISITPTINSGHIFYTSSSSRSTKYYCDTDSAWTKLSAENLRSFVSEQELLATYPNKTISKPCK
jgi:hypothetical protein